MGEALAGIALADLPGLAHYLAHFGTPPAVATPGAGSASQAAR